MNWLEHFRRRAENVDQEIAAEKARQQSEAERELIEQMANVEAGLLSRERAVQAVSEILQPAEEVFQRIIGDFFMGRGSVAYSPLDYKPGHNVTSYNLEIGNSSYHVRSTWSRSVKLNCPNPNSCMQLSVVATEGDPNPELTGEFYAHYFPGRRGLGRLPGFPKEKAERGYNALYSGKFEIVDSGTSDFRRKLSGDGDILVKSDLQEFLERTAGQAAFEIIRMRREGIK